MRLLHTADWHLGKVLKGVDRLPEQGAVLAEVVAVTAAEGVDLVVVAGDVFESGAPPPEAQRLAFETLLALRATGADVVVIAGNHDNADAFEAVRPVFAAAGIHVLGRPCRPDAGGVVTVAAARTGEAVRLALLPFPSQRAIVRAADLFGGTASGANDRYAERVAKVIARLTAGFDANAVNVLVAHGTVTGARFGGGEREAQSIFDYHVPADVFPLAASYVALGHLHRTQEVPARCPAWYAGSPIAVDFGEEAASPSVLVVDAAPGAPARVRRVELTAPRRLRTVTGTVAELAAADVGDALLRVVVTEPARAGLGDEVRALLPNAIDIQVAAPAAAPERRPSRAGRTTVELFHQYLAERNVEDPAVEALFAELLERGIDFGGRVMRPLLLRIRGFGAFRDETVVDFADTDVFALVGPTGSGKSTVIDAICFALYGSVPRHGEKAVGVVVSVGSNEAAVELTFERAGERFVAARVVRRSGHAGRATTKEARLERHGRDGSVEVVAGAARELGPAVEELLGLGFDHFTRCVVLPQGEFARFLHDKPADRQALLEQLLGLGLYDVLVKQANQRAAEAQAAAGLAERALDDLPAADDESLDAARRRLVAVEALGADVAAAQPELDALQAEVATATEGARAATALAGALRAVVVPEAVAELAVRLTEARHEQARVEAVHGDAAAAQERYEARLAAYPPLASLEAAAQAHLRVGTGNHARAERADQAAVAEAARSEADAAAEAAERAEAEARAALDAVRAAHAAHDLAGHLVAGAACPVCQQVVTTVPKRTRTPALKAAEEGVVVAERARRAGVKAASEAADGAHRAHAEPARVEAKLQALLDQVVEHPDPEALVALLAEASQAATDVAEARRHVATAGEAVAAARHAVTQLEEGLRRAAAAFHAQRDSVAAAGPPPPGDDLAVAWKVLAQWAGEQAPVVAQRAAAAAAVAEEAARTLGDQEGALTARAGALGLTTGGALVVAVARAEEQARHAVEAIEAARRTGARLRGELDDHRRRYAVAHELARHLASAGFPRWLVGEALDLLVDDASVLLRRLSGGQYSLEAVDGGSDLDVIDHANADERRPVRSLSGGETFQASLAFALALSDHLASLTTATAARLDAIFLDEGFGTLDADSLDTVAATIEALAGGGRMVGIVTHVRELAERVPVRYVVRKGPRTATVERVVAWMRVVVEAWDPSYGSPVEGEALVESTAEVNLGVEVDPAEWAPRRPDATTVAPDVIVFVDGVRRVDARVWVRADDDPTGAGAEPGLCASWAAGAVRCEPGGARLGAVELGRGLFSASRHAADLVTPHGTYGTCMARSGAPEVLSLALQERMGAAERVAAERAAGADAALVVLDGPLRGRQHLPRVVGMVKTHHVAYLSGAALAVLATLAPGERTPAFTVGTSWTRHSWYVRLPGPPGAPLAGVVRCECPADVAPAALTALADLTAVVLPRYASEAHKDARAPQNLYPIAGLERELRRRLGDPALLHRALRVAGDRFSA